MNFDEITNNFETAIKNIEKKGYIVLNTVFPDIQENQNSNENVIIIAFSYLNFPKTVPIKSNILVDKEDFFVEIYRYWDDYSLFTLGCIITDVLNWTESLSDMRKGGV